MDKGVGRRGARGVGMVEPEEEAGPKEKGKKKKNQMSKLGTGV